MKKIVPMLFIGGCLLASLSQCTKDKAPLPTPVVVTPVCDSTKVLYCNKVKPIIDANCATSGCHNAGASAGDFTNNNDPSTLRDEVKSGNFKDFVIVNKSMPIGFSLSADDLNTLTLWLDSGAN